MEQTGETTSDGQTPADTVLEPAFARNNVPVFFACDHRFLPHTMTAVHSVIANAGADVNLDLFVVGSDLPEADRRLAGEWVGRFPNVSLRFIDVDRFMPAAGHDFFVENPKRFSIATYYRFFAPVIFSRYEKIIYLDSDLVVLGDIAQLYNHDLGDNLLAAAHDYHLEAHWQADPNSELAAYYEKILGLSRGKGYFNAGVLVMNLAAMRSENTHERLLATSRRIEKPKLADQDILNAVCAGETLFLESKWNFMEWMADSQERSAKIASMPEEMRASIRRNRGDVKLVHYVETKPWRVEYAGNRAEDYWRHAKATPFYGRIANDRRVEGGTLTLLARYVILCLQTVNFRLRLHFCGQGAKKKYQDRLRSIELRRQAIVRHVFSAKGEG